MPPTAILSTLMLLLTIVLTYYPFCHFCFIKQQRQKERAFYQDQLSSSQTIAAQWCISWPFTNLLLSVIPHLMQPLVVQKICIENLKFGWDGVAFNQDSPELKATLCLQQQPFWRVVNETTAETYDTVTPLYFPCLALSIKMCQPKLAILNTLDKMQSHVTLSLFQWCMQRASAAAHLTVLYNVVSQCYPVIRGRDVICSSKSLTVLLLLYLI